jgi:hypothetical protein
VKTISPAVNNRKRVWICFSAQLSSPQPYSPPPSGRLRRPTRTRRATKRHPATAYHTHNRAHHRARTRPQYAEMATTRAVNIPTLVAHATVTAAFKRT